MIMFTFVIFQNNFVYYVFVHVSIVFKMPDITLTIPLIDWHKTCYPMYQYFVLSGFFR